MSGKPAQKTPSFYKLMIGNFTHSLPVPPAFMQKHGLNLPKNVKLRISSGGTWNVKLEKMKDQSYCFFGCGWSKFAEDVGLKFGEFLLFWFVGGSMFHVAVYKIHGYQREIPTMSTNHPTERPSFFKIMDSTQLLALPPVVVREYGVIMQLENVKLRISSGETWNVKLEKREDEDYCFTRGWRKFAQEAGLKNGEFLVFWYDGNSTFDVAVYMQNACEREIQIPPNLTSCNIKSTVKERSRPLYFEMCLKKHQESRMTLPRGFWRAAGLKGKESVRLVYLPNNSYKDVVLDLREKYGIRIDMTTTWSQFRKENGLEFEKYYSFEFMPSNNVIHVNKITN